MATRTTLIRTFKYRIKDASKASELSKMAGAVNFVWNFCNQTAMEYLDKRDKWVTGYDLDVLSVGCSQLLGIPRGTITCICKEYVRRRKQTKKRKLSWRSKKRSLGWIPFRNLAVNIKDDGVVFYGHSFKFWNSRPCPGNIRCGSFNQDARGRWYLNATCKIKRPAKVKRHGGVGIDLGLKTFATLSNGIKISRDNITLKYAQKLAVAQRAKKKGANIHAKIKNVRRDWNHKESSKLINTYNNIIVGDVSPSRLKKTRLAKSISDASWADFKSMLAYKAIALGVDYKEINEKFSTVTCSVCFERTGPSGLGALGVREWTCKCGASHDRDVNAAKNIFRFGCESPIKGIQNGGHQL